MLLGGLWDTTRTLYMLNRVTGDVHAATVVLISSCPNIWQRETLSELWLP